MFETKAAPALQGGPGRRRRGASAVVLKSGVATTPNFVDGVAVIVHPIGGDDGSRHWRAAVHLSGQVSPATLGQPRSGWEPSAARARAVERCGEAGSIYPGWGPGRHASVLFPVAVRNATAPSYGSSAPAAATRGHPRPRATGAAAAAAQLQTI